MRKYILSFLLVFALILTGCGKKSSKDKNEIDGIKLDKNLTTYAFRYAPYDLNETEQVILRYNKSGELKYLEFDYIYDIDKSKGNHYGRY